MSGGRSAENDQRSSCPPGGPCRQPVYRKRPARPLEKGQGVARQGALSDAAAIASRRGAVRALWKRPQGIVNIIQVPRSSLRPLWTNSGRLALKWGLNFRFNDPNRATYSGRPRYGRANGNGRQSAAIPKDLFEGE